MRKLLTLIVILLSAIGADAQYTRCRAISFLHNDGTVPTSVYRHDSTQYYYSHGREGKYSTYYNYWRLNFDSSYKYIADNGKWKLEEITIHRINSANKATDAYVLNAATRDSIYHISYIYTAAGDTSDVNKNYYKNGKWLLHSKTQRTFDTARRLTSLTVYVWDVDGVMYGDYKYTYTYNSAGDVIEQSTPLWNRSKAAWEDAVRVLYTYNGRELAYEIGEELMPNGIWKMIGEYTYHYAGGRLDSIICEGSDGINWGITVKYGYKYNAVGLCDTEYTYGDDISLSNRRLVYEYSPTKKLVRQTQQWNNITSWENQTKNELTYDKFDNETSHGNIDWENGQWEFGAHNFIYRLYYEAYNPQEASVAHTNANSPKVDVYPIPSANMINVLAEWKTPEHFTISITGLDGRLVKQWEEKPCAVYKQTIPVNTLPAGNYIIHLQSAEGAAAKQFIVK